MKSTRYYEGQSSANPYVGTSLLPVVQANCLMLLFTAHDTVASTLALMLRFLKQNPEALQKLRAEQRQVSKPPPPPHHMHGC